MITEKRFTIDEDIVAGCFCLHDGTIDSVDGYVLYDEKEHCENVCDLLNKLNDENEQLKQQNEFLKKKCNEYWEELGLNSDYFE